MSKKYGKRLRLSPHEEQLIYTHRGTKVKNIKSPKILSLDIETALMEVYVWGLYKQQISHKNIVNDWFVLCWAGKWLFKDKVISDTLLPKEAIAKNDERIIKSVWKILDEADIVITHNGIRFDHRKLNARFIYYGLVKPSPYLTIDTLRVAQKELATSSHKQDYLTKYLKLPEKLHTEIELWYDCMKGKRLKEMVKYCRRDVRGLEEMYLTLRSWISNHPNLPIFTDVRGAACPACMNQDLKWKGFHVTPTGRYKTFRCNKCGAVGRSRNADNKNQRKDGLVKSF